MSPNRQPKQVILAAHFPGVNNTTVWNDPRSRSQIDFASFEHLARTAERGKLDFFFLAEGLRLREQGGKIHDLDVVGRPDTLTVLAALAAITTHLGLAGTLNATFREPVELARQLATLDHLSERTGGVERGHVVRRLHRRELPPRRLPGLRGPLPAGGRAWWRRSASCGSRGHDDDLVADADAGRFLARGRRRRLRPPRRPVRHRGPLRRPPQPPGPPVILQAGDSDGGRELAAAEADADVQPALRITSDARRFYADVKGRLARYGRARRS